MTLAKPTLAESRPFEEVARAIAPRPGLTRWLPWGVALAGWALFLASFASWGGADPALLGVLAALLVASELLAVQRPTWHGPVSFTFAVMVAAVLLAGGTAASLLGLLAMALGDGLLRRSAAGDLLQRSGLLLLMVAAGAWLLQGARGADAVASLGLHAAMAYWSLVLFWWVAADCRLGVRFRPVLCTAMVAQLALVLLWTASLWSPLLAVAGLAELLASVTGALAFGAGFMLVDSLVISVLLLASQGRAGLIIWRGSLLPIFYRYNGLALVGLALATVYAAAGLTGLVLAGSVISLLFLAYRQEVRLQETFSGALCTLSAALDAKDPYTAGHSERVARYAVAMASRLGWGAARRRDTELAGRLHDIGKIGIPDAILLKPGKLTAEEFEVVKSHVPLGVGIVRGLPGLERVAALVGQDHERWDGSGYPRGLRGEAIPEEARAVAVADVYDALTSDRPYRQALAPEVALGYLRERAGVEFDPRMVEALATADQAAALQPVLEYCYCLTH